MKDTEKFDYLNEEGEIRVLLIKKYLSFREFQKLISLHSIDAFRCLSELVMIKGRYYNKAIIRYVGQNFNIYFEISIKEGEQFGTK